MEMKINVLNVIAIDLSCIPGSGAIDFQEFLVSFQETVSPPSSDELSSTFAMMDQNGDGFLTKDEIKAGLMQVGEPMSDETVDEMLRVADKNNDGKVSYQGECRIKICNSLFLYE